MELKLPLLTLLNALLLCVLSSSEPLLHTTRTAVITRRRATATATATTSSTAQHELWSVVVGILLGSTVGFIASLLFLYLIRLLILYANRAHILKGPVVFSPTISPKALQSALCSSALQPLGGKYYKADLVEEQAVAVKVVEPLSTAPNSKSHQRRVQQELEALAMLKHRNVMSLRAYVRDQKYSLVYDFVGGGSLEDLMVRVRGQEVVLGWDARHRISVGIVKGLRYLHFEYSPRMLHYRLRPSNVMLEQGYEPRLGDCGLPGLLAPCCFDLNGAAVGAAAAQYVSPECFQSCRYTDKSDVYSFGMILAVLLTGKDPSDPFFSEEAGRGSLGRWLRHLQQAGEAREALDKTILGDELEEEEMLMAIRIALVCLSDLPADRPSSDELVAMLTQLHSF